MRTTLGDKECVVVVVAVITLWLACILDRSLAASTSGNQGQRSTSGTKTGHSVPTNLAKHHRSNQHRQQVRSITTTTSTAISSSSILICNNGTVHQCLCHYSEASNTVDTPANSNAPPPPPCINLVQVISFPSPIFL